ncbi:MAG TPA: arginine repressor [Actinomycetota bacterium]|nr:arginine repressor [Actinomycetota bacterium]
MRSRRRGDLVRILRKGHASSQREIVKALRAAGHDVTQATVSRDLRAIGATKVRAGDELVYRLPDDGRAAPASLAPRGVAEVLAEFALDVRPAAALVVVTTAPGHAAAVARAIDLAGVDDVVGTVAGDDTVFVATARADAARRVAGAWSKAFGWKG